MSKSITGGFTTKDEIRFIDGIGRHSESVSVSMAPKSQLLRGYISACEKRADWQGIDSAACINAAKNALAIALIDEQAASHAA